MSRTISLSIDVASDADLPRVMEALSNHGVALLMEGFNVRVYAYTNGDGEDFLEELSFVEEQ